jgi:TRAP-type C4-dicarboxylate transport system substrate-binding protein
MGTLRGLGADPVDMPMGDVYSALSKNVIDGVVAPTDTLRSLHFGEVAKHFSTLHISRGAYPARAMSKRVWDSLTPDMQAVLTEGALVWEAALAEEVTKAAAAGDKYGHESGIIFTPASPADQARFDKIYNDTALTQARSLKSIGIDAEPVFHRAQALIAMDAPARAVCAK